MGSPICFSSRFAKRCNLLEQSKIASAPLFSNFRKPLRVFERLIPNRYYSFFNNIMKIEGMDNTLCKVDTTSFLVDTFVTIFVITGCRYPAYTANKALYFHLIALLSIFLLDYDLPQELHTAMVNIEKKESFSGVCTVVFINYLLLHK
jgi:hypothetical protein